jgi:methionine-rich copper-binding protein CopC
MEQTTGSPDNDRTSGTFENLTPMSHKEVVDKNVVESYVRKELSPERELQFEAHYFECRDCAEAVAAEQEQRPVFSRPQPWWRRLAFPVLTPVTAALFALAVFQNFYSIPSLKAQLALLSVPQANTVITAHPVQMGIQDGESLRTPSATIELILPTGTRSPFYKVELLGQGREPLKLMVPTPQGSRLSLHVTTETLGHGSYSVLVYGLEKQSSSDGQKIGQYYFNLQ